MQKLVITLVVVNLAVHLLLLFVTYVKSTDETGGPDRQAAWTMLFLVLLVLFCAEVYELTQLI